MKRWRLNGKVWVLMGCAVLLFSYGGCRTLGIEAFTFYFKRTVKKLVKSIPIENYPPYVVGGSVVLGTDGVLNLEPGWSQAVQQYWYYTSQGTQIILYSWFLNLEEEGSTELIRSDNNMDRLRYLLQTPTGRNPDGLPVGFVKDVNPEPDLLSPDPDTSQWFGVTCAACHTAQFTYEGHHIRVDGGPGMGDFNMLLFDLILPAMKSTLGDADKFDRFRIKVGDPNGTLRQDLKDRIDFLQTRADINEPPPGRGGYARLDAVNNIFNAVAGQAMGIFSSPNTEPADAPVSYPAVWDAPHTDLVQWAGFFSNRSELPSGDVRIPEVLSDIIDGSGPVVRNLGEVLGVVGTFEFKEERVYDPKEKEYFTNEKGGYESSARITEQGWLEAWLTDLWSPVWPDTLEDGKLLLPPIDTVRAKRGKKLYLTYCVACHVVMKDTRDPDREIRAQMWPLPLIGTDPENASDFVDRGSTRIPIAKLPSTRLETYYVGDELTDSSTVSTVLTNAIAGTLGRKPAQLVASAWRSSKTNVPIAEKFDPKAYRSRPLNGVWATGPFLHNGSVPNLWELLKVDKLRVDSFLVGNREFDPVNVGYSTIMPTDGHASMLNTTLPGNSNAGHNYGTEELTDDERWDLIEYIKTL